VSFNLKIPLLERVLQFRQVGNLADHKLTIVGSTKAAFFGHPLICNPQLAVTFHKSY
jgi:hypothetical protein